MLFSSIKVGSKIETVVGPESEIEGSLRVKESVRIDGKVKGGITAESVVVGIHGTVMGDIHANNVSVAGRIKGNVTAANIIELFQTGHVLGDLKTSKIIIAEGATFEGNCHMMKSDTKAVDLGSDSEAGGKHLKIVSGNRR